MKVELIDKILYKFNNLDKVKLVIKTCEKLSDEEALELFKVLEDNKCIFKLLEDNELINKFSSKKLIEIINILKDNNYNENVLNLLIEEAKNQNSDNSIVDKNLKDIISEYKSDSYNQEIYELIILLKNKIYSEILEFVKIFKDENIKLNQISTEIIKNDNLSPIYKYKFLSILNNYNYDPKLKDFLLETVSNVSNQIYDHIYLIVESNFDKSIKRILFSKIFAYKNFEEVDDIVRYIMGCSKDLKEIYTFLICEEKILSKKEFDDIFEDVKKYYQETPKKKFDNIVTILSNSKINIQRTYKETKDLINYYKESKYDDNVYNIILDKEIIKNRTYIEQAKFIEFYMEYKNDAICKIIRFNQYLTYNFSSQIKIIENLAETNFNESIVDILCNKKVVSNKSLDEIVYLMNILKENSHERGLYKIINNDNLNKIRSFSQIKELIDMYIESNYDNKILNVILDENLLLSRFENQKNRIQNIIDQKEPFLNVLNEIKSLDEMKEYLKTLKKESVEDVYNDTAVPILSYKTQ